MLLITFLTHIEGGRTQMFTSACSLHVCTFIITALLPLTPEVTVAGTQSVEIRFGSKLVFYLCSIQLRRLKNSCFHGHPLAQKNLEMLSFLPWVGQFPRSSYRKNFFTYLPVILTTAKTVLLLS